MLIVVEILFILLLVMILFMFYMNERSNGKSRFSHATAEECWSGRERRQHVRFKKDLDIKYTIKKNSSVNKNGKTVDISQGGMKLLLDEKLAKGTQLRLLVELPEIKKTAALDGEVVWSEDAVEDASGNRMFHSGVMFSSIKDPSGKNLADYIKSIALDFVV